MSKEDNIREILTDAVEEIVKAQSNPRTWLSWLVFLLARMEEKTTSTSADKDSFLEMLSALQDEIRNRMKTGGWH